jgi:NTE family protein
MDGALVNPVPISAARALGARVVIAVNLNADLLGRGGTIQDYGAEPELPPPPPPPPAVSEASEASDGLIERAAKSAKRQFFGTMSRPGISTIMVDAFNIMQDRITRARLAGDPPDVLINPRLGRIGWFDFHRADETIAIGVHAAEQSLEPVTEAVAALS